MCTEQFTALIQAWGPLIAAFLAGFVALRVQERSRRHALRVNLFEKSWTGLQQAQGYLTRLDRIIADIVRSPTQENLDAFHSTTEEFIALSFFLPPNLDDALSRAVLALQRAFEHYGLKEETSDAPKENLQAELANFRSLAREWKSDTWKEASLRHPSRRRNSRSR